MLKSHAFSPVTRGRALTGVALTIALGGLALLSNGAQAQPFGPFESFLGDWKGAGQIVVANKGAEQIRCRAKYTTSADGRSLSQSLLCASDSYRVDIHSFAVADAQDVQGHWEEATRQVSGRLIGRVAGGRLEGNVTGPAFTAAMSLSAGSGKQTIVIVPQGGDISRVSIALSRSD
jgi:hypothetical protein